MEEGFIGALLGAVGGIAPAMSRSSKESENKSIVPLIAAGRYDDVIAGANVGLQTGALTKEQYDQVKERADVLNGLRDQHRGLLSKLGNYVESVKGGVEAGAETLKTLRTIKDFSENLDKTPVDKSLSPYEQKLNKRAELGGIVSQALKTPVAQDAMSVLEDSLKENDKMGDTYRFVKNFNESMNSSVNAVMKQLPKGGLTKSKQRAALQLQADAYENLAVQYFSIQQIQENMQNTAGERASATMRI